MNSNDNEGRANDEKESKVLMSLSLFMLLFGYCVTSVSAAANTSQFTFNGKVGGVLIDYKDVSKFNRISTNASQAKAVYGVDWKGTTHNAGSGGYKIWVRLGNGAGARSNGYFLGYLYKANNIPTNFALQSGNTVVLQAHREHINNPVETINGTYGVGSK